MSYTYKVSHYAHIAAAEARHFWFRGRIAMLRVLIQNTMPRAEGTSFLDIGCGTGSILAMLERMGFAATGLDVNARALSYAASVSDATVVRSTVFAYVPRRKFAAAGAFDVMEHITDDLKFLTSCSRFLTTGGYLFLTVPAHPKLWSRVDALSGHRRRYTKEGLRALVSDAGFRIVSLGYWNALLLPFYFVWHRIAGGKDPVQNHLATPHPIVNALLYRILFLESMFLPGRWPFGATLVCVARKV